MIDQGTEEILNLPPWLTYLFAWFTNQPVIASLLALVMLDIISGTLLSMAKGTLCSTVSFRGMTKKALMLCLLTACGVLQKGMPGFPLFNGVAFFYIITEVISIMEHAAAAGVPLPPGLKGSLLKMRETKVAQRALQESVLPAKVEVTLERKSHVEEKDATTKK